MTKQKKIERLCRTRDNLQLMTLNMPNQQDVHPLGVHKQPPVSQLITEVNSEQIQIRSSGSVTVYAGWR